MSTSPRLGNFHLVEKLSSGGLGDVWRARISGCKACVALKVIQPPCDEQTLLAIAERVREWARLNHPGVLCMLSLGVITPGESDPGRRLESGQAYIVTKYLDAPQVRFEELTDWGTTRHFITQILDSLAHAHARGVVHGGLHPGSFLWSDARRGRRLILSGFGMSRAIMSTASDLGAVSAALGAPYYSPPEVIQGDQRAFDPQVDFYSLGCLAYEMVCGVSPFFSEEPFEVAMNQMRSPPPPLKNLRFEVPEGLEAWIHSLMQKQASDRPEFAADILQSLEGIASLSVRIRGHSFAPLCGDGAIHPAPASLSFVENVGFEFFGLREFPLVGFHETRARLEASVQRVRSTWKPYAVIVRGGPGVGKTRLAKWLTLRLEELGAARTLHITHDPLEGLASGIGRSIEEKLKVSEMERWAAYQRIHQHLKQLFPDTDELQERMLARDAGALLEVFKPTPDVPSDGDFPASTISGPRERHELFMRLFRAWSRDRPLVLWFDDVHWGRDALDFALYLLREESLESSPPLLLILTARDDLLKKRPLEMALIEEIQKEAAAEVIQLENMTPEEQETHLDNMVCFEPRVRSRLCRHTLGQPLFAQQLILDFIERDALIPDTFGKHGILPRAYPLPYDLPTLFLNRIDRLFEGGSPREQHIGRFALEIAAALGQTLDREEWEGVCYSALLMVSGDFMDKLFDRGIASPTPLGWTFVNPALRETLIKVARDKGRWSDHHRRCAASLKDAGAESHRRGIRRVAEHLVLAGDDEDASPMLLKSALDAIRSGEFCVADQLLDWQAAGIANLNLPPESEAYLENQHTRAWSFALNGAELDTIVKLLNSVRIVAEKEGLVRILGDVFQLRASILLQHGHVLHSLTAQETALKHHRTAEHIPGIIEGLLSIAELHLQLEAPEKSTPLIMEALEACFDLPDFANALRAMLILARCFTQAGKMEEARDHVERALDLAVALGHRSSEALAHEQIALVMQLDSRWVEASERWQEAVILWRAIADPRLWSARVKAALASLEGNEYKAAGKLFEAAFKSQDNLSPAELLETRLGRLCCAAHRCDWLRWDETFPALLDSLQALKLFPNICARWLEQAGNFALAGGSFPRALDALRAARDQWKEAAEEADLQRVSFILKGLGG